MDGSVERCVEFKKISDSIRVFEMVGGKVELIGCRSEFTIEILEEVKLI